MDINELFFVGHNKYGQAGIGQQQHNQSYILPKQIFFTTFIKQISCGSHHSALLTIDGEVYTMGSNIHGTLGCQSIINYSFKPIKVKNLQEVSKIQSGNYHMCAISEGQLYSWGKGIQGQLGHGNMKNSFHPTKVQTLGNQVEDVSCGGNHTLALIYSQKEKQMFCYSFGNGIYGQLGTGNNRSFSQPAKVKLSNIQMISAGQNHSLFVSNNIIYGCGDNSHFQICHDVDGKSKKYLLEPVRVQLSKQEFTDIDCHQLSCSLDNQGNLYVWGGINSIWPPHQIKDINGLNVQTIKQKIYVNTKDGKLMQIQITKKDCSHQSIIVKKRIIYQGTVMDYSVSDIHMFIIGDIKGKLQYEFKNQQMLETINLNEQLFRKHLSQKQIQNQKQQKQQYGLQLSLLKDQEEISSQIQGQLKIKQIIQQTQRENKKKQSETQKNELNKDLIKPTSFNKFSIQRERQKLIYLMDNINNNLTHLTKKSSTIKCQTFENSEQSIQGQEIVLNKIIQSSSQMSKQIQLNIENQKEVKNQIKIDNQKQQEILKTQILYKKQVAIENSYKRQVSTENSYKRQVPIQKIFKSFIEKNIKKNKITNQNKQNTQPKKDQSINLRQRSDQRVLQEKCLKFNNNQKQYYLKPFEEQNKRKFSPSNLSNLGCSKISQKSIKSTISCSQSNIRKVSQISEITKCNRVLRSQLRQKDLKISKLQGILSEKQNQIQMQRKIIQYLRINLKGKNLETHQY